jgi:hypothetical protein
MLQKQSARVCPLLCSARLAIVPSPRRAAGTSNEGKAASQRPSYPPIFKLLPRGARRFLALFLCWVYVLNCILKKLSFEKPILTSHEERGGRARVKKPKT